MSSRHLPEMRKADVGRMRPARRSGHARHPAFATLRRPRERAGAGLLRAPVRPLAAPGSPSLDGEPVAVPVGGPRRHVQRLQRQDVGLEGRGDAPPDDAAGEHVGDESDKGESAPCRHVRDPAPSRRDGDEPALLQVPRLRVRGIGLRREDLLHQSRHDGNADVKAIQRLLGHASAAMTLDRPSEPLENPEGSTALAREGVRRRRDLNPRSPCEDSTLAGWCTRPDYATSPGARRPRGPGRTQQS